MICLIQGIDDLLNNYVSSGDYLVVEKATKEYLKDILYYARRIDELNDNEEFIMVLQYGKLLW